MTPFLDAFRRAADFSCANSCNSVGAISGRRRQTAASKQRTPNGAYGLRHFPEMLGA